MVPSKSKKQNLFQGKFSNLKHLVECVVILANFQAIPNVPYKNDYKIQLLLTICISLVFTTDSTCGQ